MPAQHTENASASTKPVRKLKPEVAARLAARRREAELRSLYETPVEQLSPSDLAKMKAAFFRGVSVTPQISI